MQDKKKKNKDILERIKEFPDVKARPDFLESVHEKIRSEGIGIDEKKTGNRRISFQEKLKLFWGNYGIKYAVPALGIVLLAAVLYFMMRDKKEIITQNVNNDSADFRQKEKWELLTQSDMNLLDSLLKEQKKVIDRTSGDIDMTIRTLTENGGKNFARIFAEIYKIDSLNTDTLTYQDINKAGMGSQLDKELKIKIEKLDSEAVEKIVKELSKR